MKIRILNLFIISSILRDYLFIVISKSFLVEMWLDQEALFCLRRAMSYFFCA